MEIRKLTVNLLDDWLDFFDNTAFTDNDGWAGCYCMCYHWNDKFQRKKPWNCSKDDAPYNRKCAVELIKKGKMQGYIAYAGGKVVGWCNANDKDAYDNVNFHLPPSEDSKKVKAVVCFCIAPDERGKGTASALLERVCADAASDGYDLIEAYPFCNNENNSYHGPQAMYEKFGFKQCGSIDGCNILRKTL